MRALPSPLSSAPASSAGQSVSFSGSVAKGGDIELTLLGKDVSILALSQAIAMDPAVTGTASFQITAQGKVERPRIGVNAGVTAVGFWGKPAHDALISVAIDAPKGTLESRIEAHSNAGMDAEISGQAQFAQTPTRYDVTADIVIPGPRSWKTCAWGP